MKWILLLITSLVVSPVCFSQTATSDNDFNYQTIYRIKNVKTQKAMEVEEGAFNKGSKVQQYFPYSRNGFVDGHNQEWLIIPAGKRQNIFVFYIINNGFLKYLDSVLPLSVAEGNDGDNQLWVFEKIGQNFFIKSYLGNQYLEMPEGLVNDGDRFSAHGFTGRTNQQFILIRTGSTVPTNITHGVLVNIIPSNATSKALDASGATERDGEPLRIYDLRNAETKQQWQINLTPTYYELKPKSASAKCAEVLNFSNRDADPVGCWSCVNGLNQKWIIVPVAREPDKYIFFNRNSGKCLSAPASSPVNGTSVIQNTFSNKDNNKWKIILAR